MDDSITGKELVPLALTYSIQTEEWTGSTGKWKRLVIDLNENEIVARNKPTQLLSEIFDHIHDLIMAKLPDVENYSEAFKKEDS